MFKKYSPNRIAWTCVLAEATAIAVVLLMPERSVTNPVVQVAFCLVAIIFGAVTLVGVYVCAREWARGIHYNRSL